MALSTLSRSVRPGILVAQQRLILAKCSAPMASSAHDEMESFWRKNEKLGRPVAPWINYQWEFPMLTSLTHRTTGIVMAAGLYAIGVGYLVGPDTFPQYVDLLKSWNLGPAFWYPLKSLMAFPLLYHYLNGFRHLWFDFKGGYEIEAQYRSGYIVYGIAIATALAIGGAAYI